MEVIAVRRIVIRSNDALEETAGAQVDFSQKSAFVAFPVPAVEDTDLSPVR